RHELDLAGLRIEDAEMPARLRREPYRTVGRAIGPDVMDAMARRHGILAHADLRERRKCEEQQERELHDNASFKKAIGARRAMSSMCAPSLARRAARRTGVALVLSVSG